MSYFDIQHLTYHSDPIDFNKKIKSVIGWTEGWVDLLRKSQ